MNILRIVLYFEKFNCRKIPHFQWIKVGATVRSFYSLDIRGRRGRRSSKGFLPCSRTHVQRPGKSVLRPRLEALYFQRLDCARKREISFTLANAI